jgi:hypothetical protein
MRVWPDSARRCQIARSLDRDERAQLYGPGGVESPSTPGPV